MRVVVAAIGSRGDVVPFAHLAARFADAGHDVTLVTHRTLRHLARPSLHVVDVDSDPAELMAGPAARAMRRGNLRELNQNRDFFADFLHSAHRPAREALTGADVLVASTFAIAAVDEALRRQVPVVRAHMWPEYPGYGGPMPLLPYEWLVPGPAKRLARWSLRHAEQYLGGVKGWWERGRLHLVKRHPVGLTTATLGSLYAFSPHLLAEQPAGGAVTGWWTDHDEDARISPEVAEALSDGAEWIYAGFGSMAQSNPERLLFGLAAACQRLGIKAVAQVGGLRGSPHPNLLCVGDEPHDDLFRRVRVVIHHGGAGTTGSAVRAGTPSVVVPHFADQFYWGRRLHALGVAPAPTPRPFLSGRTLRRLIDAAFQPPMAQRAGTLAERVRGEDGTGAAVHRVEQWLNRND